MDKWVDWIYLAKSEYKEGNVGVFAARQFPAGMPVGFYIGPQVWISTKVGGKEPNQKRLEAELPKKHQEYQVPVRNLEGTMVVYNPEPLERFILRGGNINPDGERKPLYMGVHYMNDCSNGMESDSVMSTKVERDINVVLVEDGCVITKKQINVSEEMYLRYHRMKKEDEGIEANDESDDDSDAEDEEEKDDEEEEDKKPKARRKKRTATKKKSPAKKKKSKTSK
jgi:hypothetical protein